MNKYYIIILGFLLSLTAATIAQAQPTDLVQVTEQKFDKRQMSTVTANFEATTDEVIDAFQKHLRKAHKVKIKSGFFGGKNYVAEKAELTAITPDRIDLFVRIDEGENKQGAILHVAAAKGYDLIISPQRYPDEFNKLQSLIQDFAIAFNKEYYEKLIAQANATLEEARKEKENLEKESAKAVEKVESLKKELQANETLIKENEPKIKTAEDKIKQAEEDLSRMQQKIGTN
jgi:DNA repair exonuclease SbcCD ATPase subunit